MADDEKPPVTPLAAECAPRARLIPTARMTDENSIECRRVVTLLGSRDGCKVRLPHPRVAPVHAAIVNSGSEMLAIDLVTPHGTFLNELKMEHERLRTGDVLAVGPWKFQVEILPPTKDDEGFHPLGLEPAPKGVALEHLGTRRVLQPTRDVCIIGRRQGCDIVISDTGVSRTHAVLFTHFDFPAIFDLLSHNHTLVNDRPVSCTLLENDDIVTIGESRFRVLFLGSPAGIQPAKGTDGPVKPVQPPLPPPAEDLIDIKATESSQRWRIAENLEQSNRKQQA